MKLHRFILDLQQFEKDHGGDLDVCVEDEEAYICYVDPIAIPNKKPYLEICSDPCENFSSK